MNAQKKIEAATLAGAMAMAFAKIEAATKSANNPHFKSKYADLGAVIDAVKPPLIEHGLFFTQRCHPCDSGVSVETVLHHEGGDTLSLGTLFVPANKQDAQGFGSALTYARRYGLMTAFGVPAEDDDGNAAARAAPADYGEFSNGQRDPTIPGITKIRNNLNKLRRDGGKVADLEAFNALVTANKDDLQKIKDAEHSLWTGMGEDFDGFKAWIKRRREELTPKEETLGFQMLASVLETCSTRNDLQAILDEHGAVAEALDGEESRRWGQLYNDKEAAIMALANVSAG